MERTEQAAIATLDDRYEFLAEVGRGASGVVWRARRRCDGSVVAVKILRDDVHDSGTAARFAREIQIESSLVDAHVAQILESGSAAGLLFLVTPFAPDGALRARLDREGALPLDDAIAIARDVAAALTVAHANNVVHRDVKPENILLGPAGAILADFGIARKVNASGDERITVSGVAIGTAPYMSPEAVAAQRDLDARTDQYSLACVVHEMLAGDPPFPSRSAAAAMSKHTYMDAPSVRVVRNAVPAGVEYALLRALSKLPVDRFPSVAEFARALTAPPPPGWVGPFDVQHAARRQRRRKVVASGLAVLVAAAALLFVRPTPPSADPNKVMLFPLSDVGHPAENAGLSVSLAMVQSLVHADPLLGLDGWTFLEADQRANPSLVTSRVARAVSRDRGARYYVTGAIARTADSATVSLQLFDARADSMVAQEAAAGTTDLPAVVQAGARAYALLLPRLIDPNHRIDVSALLTRRKSALALWIQGEVAYRQSRFGRALALMQRAVAEDSSFALAALRGAQAASWQSDPDLAERLAAVSTAHHSALTGGQAVLASGFAAYLAGSADSAAALLRRAVALMPGSAEAPMLLGETYYHLMPADWAGDSTAARLFAEAVRRDTAFTPPLVHVAEIALRGANQRLAAAAIDRLRESNPDTTELRELVLMQRCVRGRRMDWARAVRDNPDAVTQAAHQLGAAAAFPSCAHDAFEAVLAADTAALSPARWHALIGLMGLLTAAGRDTEALAIVDAEVHRGRPRALLLFALAGEAGAPAAAGESALAAATVARYDRDVTRAAPLTRWALALARARAGDAAQLHAIAASLWRRADSTRQPGDSAYALAVRARERLLMGDTARAIVDLQALHPTARAKSLVSDLFAALPAERALLARVLDARGDHARAMGVARTLNHPQAVAAFPFLRAALRIRSGIDSSAGGAAARLRRIEANAMSNPHLSP